jgi:glycosyltransferase involved in cell wall biosynthesis
MARIGVFGLIMSPQTGGGYRFLDALMANARHSRHEFLYMSHAPRDSEAALPESVTWVGRPRRRVVALQALLAVPGSASWLSRPRLARSVVGSVAGVDRRLFAKVDLWLWPHTVMPIPQLGPPIVAIAHDMIYRHVPGAFSRREIVMRRAAERSVPGCAALLCPSRHTRMEVIGAYPAMAERTFTFAEAPTEVLDGAGCEEELDAVGRRFGDRSFLLNVGLDWPHKNHELLLRVAAELRARDPQSAPVIVLAGHRRSTRLQRSIASAGLADRVVDVGTVSSAMLAALYRRAAALVFPSKQEGFGLPLVEAMHYGLPILASDRTCIPEIVDGCGELLPADDHLAWANAIDKLIGDGSFREDLAARSRRGRDRYTWPRTWARLDEVFDRILAISPAEAARASGRQPSGGSA